MNRTRSVCMCLCVCLYVCCHDAHMEVREQCVGVSGIKLRCSAVEANIVFVEPPCKPRTQRWMDKQLKHFRFFSLNYAYGFWSLLYLYHLSLASPCLTSLLFFLSISLSLPPFLYPFLSPSSSLFYFPPSSLQTTHCQIFLLLPTLKDPSLSLHLIFRFF